MLFEDFYGYLFCAPTSLNQWILEKPRQGVLVTFKDTRDKHQLENPKSTDPWLRDDACDKGGWKATVTDQEWDGDGQYN